MKVSAALAKEKKVMRLEVGIPLQKPVKRPKRLALLII